MANITYTRGVVAKQPNLESKITELEAKIDTINTELTMLSPDSNKSVYVKGLLVSESVAANLIFRGTSGNLTGTVATTNASAAITGTGTAFTSQLRVGDQVVISGGNTLTIASIASDTSATATANASTTVSGATFIRKYQLSKLKLAASQGVIVPLSQHNWLFATRSGDALSVESSAVVDSLLVQVQQGVS